MLPELNGIEVCRRIRNAKATPVIMLTARDSVIDRVSGLDSGADDYLPKPFAIEELLARIEDLERQNAELRRRLAGGSYEGDGFEALAKLYEEGFHICPGNFGQSREEDCLFCLNLVKKSWWNLQFFSQC